MVRLLLLLILLLCAPVLALAQSPIGPGGSSSGATTGRIETPMVISSGTHTTGVGAAWVWYTSPGITIAAGQHITLSATVFLDGVNATAYVGLLDGSGHGYVMEFAPSTVTIYRSTGPTTNVNLGAVAQTKALNGWVTVTLDLWPDPVSQLMTATLVGGATLTFKSDANFPISTGTWFPAIAAFTNAGTATFTNIRSGWFAVDR